jgi:hypothetical protein
MSAIVVEDRDFVDDRNARTDQIANGTRDMRRLHVALWIVILADYQYSWVVTFARHKQIMETAVIAVVFRDERPASSNSVCEVDWVMCAGQAYFGGQLNVVAGFPQQYG